ncbi:MAG TPA: GDSL-type esterase/lipase family protein [Cellvibrio sp.]|nr:GDSL-type esterase/lipase family protein [Cellvibrio sp.]
MLKKSSLMNSVFIGYASLVLVACNHANPKALEDKSVTTSSVSSLAPVLSLSGQRIDKVRIVIESPTGQQVLEDAQAQVPKVAGSSAPNADVSVMKSDKSGSNDALTFAWKDSWRAALNFEAITPLDLGDYMAAGIVEFDLNVIELAKGGLAFKSKCAGNSCERKIPYLLEGRKLIGKGWQHLSVPLKCFMHEGDNFSAVSLPFSVEVGGEGKVAVANLNFAKAGTATVSCPDYKTLSVTPDLLNEWWSVSWWMPRHLQKLEEVKTKKNAQVIFIGDSITQGWEKDGFNVWNHNYAQYNAVALGFGGDRTENVLWRLQQGEVDGLNPKVAVLMFGTNNTGHRQETPKTTAAGIKRNLEELQQRLPNTKILLLAVFPRDEKPDGELRQINNRVNAIISGFADNKKIFFLDINKSFLDANGVLSKTIMPDLLHPNEQGYEIWAKAMEPTLKNLLKK